MGASRKLVMIGGALLGALAIAFLVSTIVLGVRLKKKSDEYNQLKGEHDHEHDQTTTPETETESICTTAACTIAAGDMIKAMDLTVQPCDNFYQFSCGNWVKSNPIPDTQSSWNRFNLLREELSRDVKDILERPIEADKDPLPLQSAKQYYKSCMGQTNTDETELRGLIEAILLKVGDLGVTLGEIRRRFEMTLLANLYVEVDDVDALKHAIYIDQPGLGINRAFLIDPTHPTRAAYQNLIGKVWPIVYPGSEGDAPSIAADVIGFETEIAKVSTAPEDRRNRTELYNPMTLDEFKDHTQNDTMIDWEKYVTEVFADVALHHGVDLGPLPSLTMIVRDKTYFSEFGNVLQATTGDKIANYLRWRLIFSLGGDVSDRLREAFFEFTKIASGTQNPPPKWKRCSDKANGALGMAISYYYVQEVLSPNFNEQMQEMITNIQASVSHIIDTVDWIHEDETRGKAKEKAGKMREFIGYPDWLVQNDTALDAYYAGLSLQSPDNYLSNSHDISRWTSMERLRIIKDPKDVTKWRTDPTVVNAFYSSTYNSISFPAGILQAPFYFTGMPIQALNYGAVGMVIGHEITHGFDDRGRQSDGDGNLNDWWDNGTVNAFVERAKCFIDQYSLYEAEEANNTKLNGINTQGENIADNGGLRQAFNAYQAYIGEHGKEQFLPGLEYTPEQLFFVAFAQIWCGSYTPQGMESQIRTGVHSPNRFRVKGVLQNSPEFSATWNCTPPDENTMCKIW